MKATLQSINARLLQELHEMQRLEDKLEPLNALLDTDWGNLGRRFSAIRKIYEILLPIIKNKGYDWLDPYCTSITDHFTPIESNLWQDIRQCGLPFLPQYPVGKYFVDFGDPIKRIALEADGKQWHDEEKDAKRDYELGEMGWTVHRFTGRETYQEDLLIPLSMQYQGKGFLMSDGEFYVI